jgi:hypothetical protein
MASNDDVSDYYMVDCDIKDGNVDKNKIEDEEVVEKMMKS